MSEAILDGDLTTLGLLPPFTPGRGYFEYLKPVDSGGVTTTLFSVLPSQRRYLVAASYKAVFSAVAGNRFLQTQLVDQDGNIYLTSQDNIAHAASTNVTVNLSPSYGSPTILGVTGPVQFHGTPAVWLPGGITMQISLIGRQAGDVISPIAVMVMTIPVGQGGYELGRNP